MQNPRPESQGLDSWLTSVGAVDALTRAADLYERAAVFAVDAQRQVVLWSAGAERLLGFAEEEALGRSCTEVVRCPQCRNGCPLGDFGDLRDTPLTAVAADGRKRMLTRSGHAFFDGEGAFAGGIEVLRRGRASQVLDADGATDPVTFYHLLSRDPAMRRVFQTVASVAETDASALLRGESGTGKELVAQALHMESARRHGPFVAVNCAALTPTLIESELFGHIKGSFTGAIKDRAGLFQQANKGTLFLDEVAELPVEFQAKLLRVLEQREVVPVGGTTAIKVDLRVIAATHRSLRSEVRAGRFREDLMYRLRVVPIFLPALRDRRGDIELLLWHFIGLQNQQGPRVVDSVNPDVNRAFLDYRWPGNVRELKNAVEYAFAVGRGPELRLRDLPPEYRELSSPARTRPKTGEFAAVDDEETCIREALQTTGGHLGRAAELLGMSRPTLWRKRKKYQIEV